MRSLFLISLKKTTSFLQVVNSSSITMGRFRGRIPEGWEKYSPFGTKIKGTCFIPFKVPLHEDFNKFLSPDVESFTPQDLTKLLLESQGLTLGLVIDLTNTTRYYDKMEIEHQNIEYKKILTEGHAVPSKNVQTNFFEAVDNFLENSEKREDAVIGVHCTHGLNRTGHLICRYMIDRLNFNPDDAIKAFNEARGHDIERENYLNDLRGIASPEESTTADVKSTRKRRQADEEDVSPTKQARTETHQQQQQHQLPTTSPAQDHGKRHNVSQQRGGSSPSSAAAPQRRQHTDAHTEPYQDSYGRPSSRSRYYDNDVNSYRSDFYETRNYRSNSASYQSNDNVFSRLGQRRDRQNHDFTSNDFEEDRYFRRFDHQSGGGNWRGPRNDRGWGQREPDDGYFQFGYRDNRRR